MPRTTWTLHTDDATTYEAAYLEGSPPNVVQGETLTLTFSFTDRATFRTLRERFEYAGTYITVERQDGELLYRDNSPQDTLLLGVEPNADLAALDVRGAWGLLAGGGETRPTAGPPYDLTFEIETLDRYATYTDHSAVETARAR